MGKPAQPIDLINFLINEEPKLKSEIDSLIDVNKIPHSRWGTWGNIHAMSEIFTDFDSVISRFFKSCLSNIENNCFDLSAASQYILYCLANILMADKLVEKLGPARFFDFGGDILGSNYNTAWDSLSEGKLTVSFAMWNNKRGKQSVASIKCLLTFLSFDEFLRRGSWNNNSIKYNINLPIKLKLVAANSDNLKALGIGPRQLTVQASWPTMLQDFKAAFTKICS